MSRGKKPGPGGLETEAVACEDSEVDTLKHQMGCQAQMWLMWGHVYFRHFEENGTITSGF